MKKRYGKHDYGLKVGILAVLSAVIFLTIGYAQFTTQLGIYGISAIVRVHKDVRIGGIFLSNATNDGISHYEEYNVKDIYGSVTLPNANSSITYDVKVLNLGNVEMGILDISGLPNNLTYSISNYNLEEPLCDDNDSSQCKLGVEKTLHITISYKESGFDENNITYPLDLSFDFRRIYTITYNGFTSTAGLPTFILEDDTKTITFNNTTGIPSNVLVTGATKNYISPTLTISDPSGNVTIYKKHLITYVLDGGTQALNQVTTIASNESVTLLDPTREEYNFGGWYNNSSFEGEAITVLSNVTSDITLYALWTEYDYFIRRAEFDGTVGNVIDTGIALYSAENVNKNFRIKFTIDSFDSSYPNVTINKNQAPTILSSMLETGAPYPGFVYRLLNSNGTKYNIKINDSHVTSFDNYYPLVSGIDVEIVRENGIMYTKVNNTVYTKVLTYKDNIDTFDIPLTIGGNINSSGNYDRTFKGTLSNVSVEFYEGNLVNNTNYTYTETRTSTSYNLDGTIEFDGTNYIDTGLNLYSAENINKDFEISLTVDIFGGNSNQATLINVKDESQNNVWPGFAYRVASGNTNFELTARWPGESASSVLNKISTPKKVKIARRNGIVYYSFDDAAETKLISTPASSLTSAFTQNVTFGASLNSSGNPFRFFSGVVSDISVKLFDS